MRLKTSQQIKNKHSQMVTGLGWTPSNNECYTVSDDKTVLKWNLDSDTADKVAELDAFVTDLQWYSAKGARSSGGELFVCGCSDGTFRLMSKQGRLEKSVTAHTGAITSLSWNYEGTALATAGEDGFVKQWSRSGNLRSKLAQSDQSIYCVTWSPDNQSVLYCSGRFIVIKPLQVNDKQTKWRAHDGTVLKVDWNPINNLIVSAGEDCRYKVWDSFGRQLYSSKQNDYAITSVSWAPNGDFFAVGSLNMILLCDRTGWAHSRSSTNSGSILALDWASDGTHIAGAGGNGAVVFGQVVDRSLQWMNYEVTLNENNQVLVKDVLNDNSSGEELDFGHRVIEMSMGYNHLIVASAKTCYVYSIKNFSTPHIFDLQGIVNLIVQTEKYFLIADNVKGMQVFTYEGRPVCSPKVATLQAQFLKAGNVTISNDALACIDRGNPTQILILDTTSGKPLTDPIKHDLEIVEISLNQTGLTSDRKLFFIDRNRDMYVYQIHRPDSKFKVATMVDGAMWNDSTEILAAISDQKLCIWYYPNVVYLDKDLLNLTRAQIDASSLGKYPRFVSFFESRCTVRRADGALQTIAISPYPALLYKYSRAAQWARCTKLCRFVNDEVLWAILATMAINAQQLDTAEMALAAIEEVDKLQYIQMIKKIPSAEGRNAELALYNRRPDDAEQILMQAQLVYRAIMMNIRLFRWERALDLAVRNKTHVDTVLAYRQRYMDSIDTKETDKKFLQYAKELQIDWATIKAKEQQEIDKEKQRGTPYRTTMPEYKPLSQASQGGGFSAPAPSTDYSAGGYGSTGGGSGYGTREEGRGYNEDAGSYGRGGGGYDGNDVGGGMDGMDNSDDEDIM